MGIAERLVYSRKMWSHLRIYWRFYQFIFLYWLHLEVFRWLVIYPKKRDTPAYVNNIHAFSKNIIINNFFYLPYFSSSLLNGTLLIILKLKLQWDSTCTEDEQEYSLLWWFYQHNFRVDIISAYCLSIDFIMAWSIF